MSRWLGLKKCDIKYLRIYSVPLLGESSDFIRAAAPPDAARSESAMDQFDQLLTCCICLDRYRNPKLLPCQHSYCMEPCMEGLVDYVKRQVRARDCLTQCNISFCVCGTILGHASRECAMKSASLFNARDFDPYQELQKCALLILRCGIR